MARITSSNLYNYSMILQSVEIYSCIYISINGSSLKSRYRVITNGNHSELWFIFTCKFAEDSIHVVLQVHANVLRYKINTSAIQRCTLLPKKIKKIKNRNIVFSYQIRGQPEWVTFLKPAGIFNIFAWHIELKLMNRSSLIMQRKQSNLNRSSLIRD